MFCDVLLYQMHVKFSKISIAEIKCENAAQMMTVSEFFIDGSLNKESQGFLFYYGCIVYIVEEIGFILHGKLTSYTYDVIFYTRIPKCTLCASY